MRKITTLSLLLIVSVQFVSCAKKEKEFVYTTVDKRFEEMRRQQLVRQTRTSFSLDNNGEALEEKISPVVNGLCEMISKDNFESPFEYEKYFSKIEDYKKYLKSISYLSNLDDKCLGTKVVYDKYPIILVQYDLERENDLYISLRVDKNKKINSLFPFFKDGFKVTYSDMPTRDGNTISTISFELEGKKAKTIYTKTPYFHTDSNTYYLYSALDWMKKGYNFVVQSNRGSHASTGDFKWLHEKNIEDSQDAIKWIRNQDYSNGKVISYGVSYDGFNALASAVGDTEGLEAVIACSAPSNASSDSFTSGKTIEPWLLAYIANRENPDEINLFSEKAHFLISENIPLEEYDNYLYGRDIADWQDLMNSKKEGNLLSYWKNRSLLKGLSKTSTPIFHIAGTANDQDSMDTVLAYEYLKKNDSDPSNHRLYIHNEGHGCGNFLTTIGKDFLSDQRSKMKAEYKASALTGDIVDRNDEIFSKEEVPLVLLTNEIEETILNDRYDVENGKSLYLGYIAKEDIIVNGVIELEVESIWNMFNSTVIASLSYTVDGRMNDVHWQVTESSRTSYYLERDTIAPKVIKLSMPPVLFEVKKGEVIYVKLSTPRDDFFDIFMNERSDYYSVDERRGEFRVMPTVNNLLRLSTEKKSIVPSEEIVENENVEITEVVEELTIDEEIDLIESKEKGRTETDVI